MAMDDDAVIELMKSFGGGDVLMDTAKAKGLTPSSSPLDEFLKDPLSICKELTKFAEQFKSASSVRKGERMDRVQELDAGTREIYEAQWALLPRKVAPITKMELPHLFEEGGQAKLSTDDSAVIGNHPVYSTIGLADLAESEQ